MYTDELQTCRSLERTPSKTAKNENKNGSASAEMHLRVHPKGQDSKEGLACREGWPPCLCVQVRAEAVAKVVSMQKVFASTELVIHFGSGGWADG